ncbi:MAG: Y-family DNA polymerase [Ktedonobacterales bacterium]|nr:Y-family DNA polymerase [Ktedonobacterales bacterium]
MSLIGVADGDNFFAGTEQLLDARLRGKAVVVLSNNDGNVIARSKEAKLLGIKMTTPRHELAPLINAGTLIARSGCWPTYEVMSRRLVWSCSHFTPSLEEYSCDEVFMSMEHIDPRTADAYGQLIKKTVATWTGIRTSLGIGPTKTLAKAAIERAKQTTGVYAVTTPTEIDDLLATLSVEDVWGLGSRKSSWLKHQGITTAQAFANAPTWWIRQHLSVVSARTQLELRGQPAFPLITARATKQEILVSRAFGRPVTEVEQLREALSFYTARACEKLRAEHRCAGLISVHVATNPFRKREPQYSNSITIRLDRPTAYTPTILAAALGGLERIYRPYPFHRVGIALREFVAEDPAQGTLFAPHFPSARERQLMMTLDAICQRFGREAIRYLGTGFARPWASKGDYRSPRALTQWAEIPHVQVR